MVTTQWDLATSTELIEHILTTHHAYLRGALPALAELAQDAAPVPVRQVLLDLKAELESHMWKEEVVLFPLIKSLEEAQASGTPAPPSHCGSVRNPIRVMGQEHQGAKQALAELRRLTNDYEIPPDASTPVRTLVTALRELEADLEQHIHLEDGILFPRAIELEAGR